MKIQSVTPVADAASPSHPDHDRWVKEKTLKMEVDHAKVLGLSSRYAETENARLLQRMDALARQPQAAPVARPKKRKTRAERTVERGVTVGVAKEKTLSPLKLSPCGRCGTCRACMRERRILLIIQKAKAGDTTMLRLAWSITSCALDAQGRAGRFASVSKRDADRIVAATAEAVCDRSVRWLGEWR